MHPAKKLIFCSRVHLIDYYRKMIDVQKNIVNILQQGALNWLLQENDRCTKNIVNILQQGALNWLLQENDRCKKNTLLIFCRRVHLIEYYKKMIDVKKNILLIFCSSVHLIDYYRKKIDVQKNIVNILQQGALNWLLQENDRCKKIYC